MLGDATTAPQTFTISPTVNTLPVGAGDFLEALVLHPENADEINIGLTPGGTDFEDTRPLNAGENNTVIIQQKFDAPATIYITGATGLITGTIYKR